MNYGTPTPSAAPSPLRSSCALAGWLALCFAAGGTTAFVSIDGWYGALNTPTWNPPAWLFGSVWMLLYATMGVAAWLVWLVGGWKVQKRILSLFLVQWVLNALWTPIFFGMHRIGLALLEISLLWLALSLTVIAS